MSDDFVSPETGWPAMQPRRVRKGHADEHWLSDFRYEAPREDPAFPDVHIYTDRMSFDPGEEVIFRGSTTAESFRLEIYRDGLNPETVHVAEELPGIFTPLPTDAYSVGCGWPIVHRWTIPKDTPSGFFRVVSSCARRDGSRFTQHHFIVVRPTAATRRARILFLLATGTWTAYNDFGGANHYFGIAGEDGQSPSPILSLERPWTRGMVWLPPGAPRVTQEPVPRFGDAPRFPVKEWGYANGFGQYYATSGWAQYERHFKVWADAEGIPLDIITQHDLHYRPDILKDYAALVVVGHDEYWSHAMRTAVERWTELGGRLARFGGNFMWQIRLEEDGRVQRCHKYRAGLDDPVREDPQKRHLTTGAWEDRFVRWPGASTVGVNAFRGIYASWGGFAPRGQRGFTVYRPRHWAFSGTGLRYADMFGQEAGIFGYEVDGLDYTFRDGLPYPVPVEGQPEDINVLAMAPAMFAEDEIEGPGYYYYVRDSDYSGAVAIVDEPEEEARRRYRYGCGMIVHMPKGAGEVFTAGSCEWVNGLSLREPFTCAVTRNVLTRFSASDK